MDEALYKTVKEKCNKRLGITVSTLVKIFLKSFATQRGVGFYIGDEDLCALFNRWMSKRQFEKARGGRVAVIGPRLKDLYNLGEKP